MKGNYLEFPNNIQIETVSTCNARCGFCPYPETSLSEPQGQMDDDLFTSIVEQISKHDVYLIQPFLNNDPLMDKKIPTRLELLIQKNPRARVMITSNGFLLRDNLARELVKLKLDTIHISSNGLTSDTYRETMAIDAYTVLQNVNQLWDRIRSAGSKTKLIVTAILLDANKREIQHMKEYWQRRGITFYLNALNNRAGNLEKDRFMRMLPFDAAANRTQLHTVNMSGCPSLNSFMGIHWNGDVIGCCNDWRRTRVFGNARNESLAAIWHGKPYQSIRRISDAGRLNEADLCRDCGENMFSIDTGALRDFLQRRTADGREHDETDLDVVSMLETFKKREPEIIQLGVVRL
jgi:MoaA/NifB/PqqE/SkfB family radical SAM enzyme